MTDSTAGRHQTSWRRDDSVLRVREQSSISAAADLVEAIDDHTWEQLFLTVSRSVGNTDWTVSAAQYAGFARLNVQGRPVDVEIAPKLDGLDLFFLCDWAYSVTDRNRAGRRQTAALEVLRTDPMACLLGWYLQSMIDFATRWLRRGYLTVEQDLTSRIRGRVLIPDYVQRSVATGRNHVIPCRFAEPTHDTAINRFLKAGLRRAVTLSAAVPVPAAREALAQLGTRALGLFGAVSDAQASPTDANRLTPSGPLRHYRPLVELTRAVLSGTFVSPDLGTQLHTAFLWDLNILFQEALRNILRGWPGASLVDKRPSVSIATAAGVVLTTRKIDPDYVLKMQNGTVLLDAKYKKTWYLDRAAGAGEDDLEATAGHQRIKINRADVYQAVSYSRHNAWRPATTALIYPAVLDHDEQLPEPLQIHGFGQPVHVGFLDVGPYASTNIEAFYAQLAAAVATD